MYAPQLGHELLLGAELARLALEVRVFEVFLQFWQNLPIPEGNAESRNSSSILSSLHLGHSFISPVLRFERVSWRRLKTTFDSVRGFVISRRRESNVSTGLSPELNLLILRNL
jgi:hypothetical protein